MKAIKSCVNQKCKSYIHKMKYNDEYIYCPMCGEKLTYVCLDCWIELPHSTEKYCSDCKEKREIKRAEQQQKIVDGGVKVAKAASAVVSAVGAAVKGGSEIIKVVKKTK